MNKPLAKSLHTVTVWVRVALNAKLRHPLLSNSSLVAVALDILGLEEQLDSYDLAGQAIKQLNKFS